MGSVNGVWAPSGSGDNRNSGHDKRNPKRRQRRDFKSILEREVRKMSSTEMDIARSQKDRAKEGTLGHLYDKLKRMEEELAQLDKGIQQIEDGDMRQ